MAGTGQMSGGVTGALKTTSPCIMFASFAVAIGLLGGLGRSVDAAAPDSNRQGSTSHAARRDAIRSIPLEKLAVEDRAKVESVLSNISIFRRLPAKVIDCDPTMYLFLVRHPDVVVNIWEIMNLSRLRLWQTEENLFQVAEPAGAVAQFSYLYRNHDTHVLYGEGKYEGPLMARPAKGRGVLVLKCGYVRETNNRYYVTSRLDCFLTIGPAGIELLGKTVSPLMGKTVDNNFTQTVAFVGSLSHTAEVNSRGVQRLATRLQKVQPEVRDRFARLAAGLSPNGEVTASEAAPDAQLATRQGQRDLSLETQPSGANIP